MSHQENGCQPSRTWRTEQPADAEGFAAKEVTTRMHALTIDPDETCAGGKAATIMEVRHHDRQVAITKALDDQMEMQQKQMEQLQVGLNIGLSFLSIYSILILARSLSCHIT
jgi:hypothetical protein